MEVLAAVDEVLGDEQRLGRDQAVRREGVVPASHQAGLTGRGDRLQGADVGRSLVESRAPRRRRRRRPDDTTIDLAAGRPERRDLAAELDDGRVGDGPAIVGE